MSARELGADVRVRTRFVAARRDGALWRATIESDGVREDVTARAIVNAAGPWVADVLGTTDATPSGARVRHVKGSHIVVPRVQPEEHAYILQNADNRIVFVIPYQERYSLIGTTDVPVDDYDAPRSRRTRPTTCSRSPTATSSSRSRARTSPGPTAACARSTTTARPILRRSRATTCSRSTRCRGEPGAGRAPVLSIYGGKITTYRKLAEHALAAIAPYFPGLKPAWTATKALPGGDLPKGDRAALLAALCAAPSGRAGATCCARSHEGTARARIACSATRRRWPTWARTSAPA